jgi:ERCC4-type nuclease
MKKNKEWVDKQIKLLEESSRETERFCHEKLGMPLLTEKEKKTQRKKLLEKILKESEGKPPIDSKSLLKEVKSVVQLLEENVCHPTIQ